MTPVIYAKIGTDVLRALEDGSSSLHCKTVPQISFHRLLGMRFGSCISKLPWLRRWITGKVNTLVDGGIRYLTLKAPEHDLTCLTEHHHSDKDSVPSEIPIRLSCKHIIGCNCAKQWLFLAREHSEGENLIRKELQWLIDDDEWELCVKAGH
ncbi:MAG: hypothetical protein Q9226_001742 [Calogaya cf. arnoldii]